MHQNHLRHRLAGLLVALCMAGGIVGVSAAPASATVVMRGYLACNFGGFGSAQIDNISVDTVRAGDWAIIQWWHWNAATATWTTSWSDWHTWNGWSGEVKAPPFYANGYGWVAATLWTWNQRDGYQTSWVPAVGGGIFCHTK